MPFFEISGSYTFKGCQAHFYKMGNSKYGIKVYRTFNLAYESFLRQKKASSYGLAPKVKRMIIAKLNNNEELFFGYETEKAREIDFECEIDKTIYFKASSHLFKQLRRIGLCGDFGETNCGILNNKLVAVDFGSHSETTPISAGNKQIVKNSPYSEFEIKRKR